MRLGAKPRASYHQYPQGRAHDATEVNSVNRTVKMKSLLLTILAFGLLSSSAFAQEGLEKKQFTRVGASGAKLRLGFYTSLNPDCTTIGNVNIRVTKQPEHGSVETTTDINFPTYPKESSRSKCNDHKVRGVQVNYKSAEKYVGDDALDLLVLFPSGFAWEVHYDISVR
jgi:hypothetical protein